MYVLGIETSCDETAASVVRDGKIIYSNVVASSLEFHKKYGGVIPEIASRMHLEVITRVTESALSQARLRLKDIDLIAVTEQPGLPGSLLVGICFAKAIGLASGVPVMGINHLYAHIYSGFLNKKRRISFPLVGLVVSGGHTSLFYLNDFKRIALLGSALDDACGEAFDKVAKIIGLGYPGGPAIEKMAVKGKPGIKFNCSDTNRPLDFSFSGIKTAVLYQVKGISRFGLWQEQAYSRRGRKRSPQVRQPSLQNKRDIAASFQEAVIATLVKKSLLACKIKKSRTLMVGGGVALNNRLRERLSREAGRAGVDVVFPDKRLCMDNAAMVAGLACRLFRKGFTGNLDLTPNLARSS